MARLFIILALTAISWAQEVRLPQVFLTPLEDATGFDDQPSMAVDADGSVYVGWVSFRDGDDTLQVGRYVAEGDYLRSVGAWRVAGGPRTYVLNPRVVAAGGRAWMVWASEVGRNWDIYAVQCSEDGPRRPIRVTTHEAIDVDAEAAWHEGALWVTWESNREGARRIFLASIRDGNVSSEELVSDDGRSNYDPSVAALSNGAVAVAWHAFGENNYDIWMRQRSANGQWQTARRLTKAPSIDRHPWLLANEDDLWLIYENAQTDRYLIGRTNARRVMVTRVTPNGLETIPGYRETERLWIRSEAGSAAFDDLGRLWLAYLKPRLPRGGWNHHLACWNGERWLGHAQISRRKGMDRRPSIAVSGDRVLLAMQVDDLSENWTQSDPALTTEARSRVLLGVADLRYTPDVAAPMKLEPLVEPEEEFEAGRLRVDYGEDAGTPTIEYDGKTLKLYYGDLHAHSDISVCNRCGDQSIDENYQHRRDLARLDFAAITDHGYNIVPYLWNYTAKLARVNEDPARLTTFLAEEWTSSFERYTEENPQGFYGHRNLILEDAYFPVWWDAYNGDSPADLWSQLRRMRASFVHIPHQLADTGNVPTDWRYVDEEAQPVAEIFQVRGSYEYLGTPRQATRSMQEPGRYLQDVWAQGKVIGVIASPDHGGGYGKACVYAEDLSRRSILEGIRRRHTFGTTAARMFLDVRVNGFLMGDKRSEPAGDRVEVKIRTSCPGEIDRIEVCRNGQFVYLNEPNGKTADLTFVDTDPPTGRSYYYVRVIQEDEEIGWTSPVWLGAH